MAGRGARVSVQPSKQGVIEALTSIVGDVRQRGRSESLGVKG